MQKEDFIGKTEDEVAKYCLDNDIPLRVRERDGKPFVGTRDWKPNRWNIKITQGIVTSISNG